mgnify:CR=1 FL=1
MLPDEMRIYLHDLHTVGMAVLPVACILFLLLAGWGYLRSTKKTND